LFCICLFDFFFLCLTAKAAEHGYIKNESVRRGFAIQDKQLDEVEKVCLCLTFVCFLFLLIICSFFQTAKNLQNMGLDMGDELDESTTNLQALGRHTDAVGQRLATTNERVVRLLNK
jgi:hypothetical protein